MQVHSAVQGGRGDGAGQQGVRLGCWQRAAGAFVCCECCAVGLRAMGWVHVLVPCMEVPSELPEVAAAWLSCVHTYHAGKGFTWSILICVGVLMSCTWAFSIHMSCSALSHVAFQYN